MRDSNSDHCTLYASAHLLIELDPPYYRYCEVYIYKAGNVMVAWGDTVGFVSGPTTIILSAVDGSGLSGSVDWDFLGGGTGMVLSC